MTAFLDGSRSHVAPGSPVQEPVAGKNTAVQQDPVAGKEGP